MLSVQNVWVLLTNKCFQGKTQSMLTFIDTITNIGIKTKHAQTIFFVMRNK